MTTEKTFKNAANRTAKLIIIEAKTQSKFVCTMRRTDTNKSVTASGTSQREAYNQALAKIK